MNTRNEHCFPPDSRIPGIDREEASEFREEAARLCDLIDYVVHRIEVFCDHWDSLDSRAGGVHAALQKNPGRRHRRPENAD